MKRKVLVSELMSGAKAGLLLLEYADKLTFEVDGVSDDEKMVRAKGL